MIGSLLDVYENMKITTNQPGYTRIYDKSKFCAWYNVFEPDSLTDNIRIMIKSIFAGDSFEFWGFKEIRFGLSGYDLMETRMNNFSELFPQVKIVFLVRNDIEAQLNSAWWANDRKLSRKLLSDQKSNFINYTEAYPHRSFLLSMEDMLEVNEKFRELPDFLGMNFDADRINWILKNKVDYEQDIKQ